MKTKDGRPLNMENKERLFNSPFEIEMRILLLLSEATTWPLSQSSIVTIDFMAVYGKEFGVSDHNLHGDSQYKFSELPSRYELVTIGIKELVKTGLITPVLKKNYQYQINDKGENLVSGFDDDYSQEYRKTVDEVFLKFNVTKTASLKDIIDKRKAKEGEK
jgi:hypothetical protein